MRHRLFCPVDQFEQHGVCYVQSCKLVESGRRHDDLATMVHVLPLRPGQHSDRVATIVFIETAGRSSGTRGSTEHAWWKHAGRESHRHGVFIVVVILQVKLSAQKSEGEVEQEAYHLDLTRFAERSTFFVCFFPIKNLR